MNERSWVLAEVLENDRFSLAEGRAVELNKETRESELFHLFNKY